MIKQIRASYSNNKKNAQYCALSTDNLPNYLKNGDEVYFIDTGKCYIYNEQTGELVEGTLSGGGGGSQGPLVLQGVFDANPFAGTVIGATKEEIIAAWNAGRQIKFKLLGYSILFTLGRDMDALSDTSKLIAYFLWQTGGTFFASGIVNLSTMTYQVIMYQGLTPYQD